MTAIDIKKSTSIADACIVDLHAYRLATYSDLDGRTRTGGGAEHGAACRRDEADDLAQTIDRLLDRIGDCLAVVT